MRLGNTFNNLLGLSGLMALALSASMAAAEGNETITVKVKTDDGLSEKVTIRDLEIGATDVFVTESGKEVLVSRDEDGLTLEVEGRNIDVSLPKVAAFGDADAGELMFLSEDHHVLHAGADAVFVTEDEQVIVDGSEKKIVVHASADCADPADCPKIKQIRVHGDATHEWVDDQGNRSLVIKRADGSTEVIELGDMLESLDAGDGDHQVITIERHVELHEDDEDH